MSNHQKEEVSKEGYKKDYALKGGQQLTVRSPRTDDAQGLIDQMKLVDSESKFLSREPGEFSFTLDQEVAFIENCINNDTIHFLVGEVAGEIVANCSVGLVMNNRRYLHRASMGIAVKKAYWHRGIGKHLMQECIDWCKVKGVEQLELEVVTENKRGLSMYKKFGFEIYGTKKHALKYADGSYADEYFMILFLNDNTTL